MTEGNSLLLHLLIPFPVEQQLHLFGRSCSGLHHKKGIGLVLKLQLQGGWFPWTTYLLAQLHIPMGFHPSVPVCTVRNQNLPLSFHAPHVFSWTTSSYWIWTAQGYPERQAWIHMCARCPGPCFKMGPVSVKAGLQRVRGGWGMGGGHHSSSPGILWWQRLLGLSLNTGRGGEWQGKGLLTGFSMRTGGSGPPFPHV